MQLLRERVDVTDPWLESIENDPLAVIKNEEEQKETQNFDVEEAKNFLRNILKPNENVSQAITRLKGKKIIKKNFKKNVRKNSVKDEEIEEKPSEEFEELCRVCSDLMDAGFDELYEWKIEDLKELRY